MRYLIAIASIPMALFASVTPLEERLEAAVLQELSTCYDEHMQAGVLDEYGAYHDLCALWMHLPSTQRRIASAINEIVTFHEEYVRGLETVCASYPDDDACESTKKELESFFENYDTEKISLCFSLFLFPVGAIENTEEQETIERLLIDYMVKKHLICTSLEEEKARAVMRLLEKSLVKDMREYCASSSSCSLQQVYDELMEVTCALDYWNKYRFVPAALEKCEALSKEEMTTGQRALQEVYERFLQQEQGYKESYSKVFGD